MAKLYQDLAKVNEFRNTRVAHVETNLNNADEAWEAVIARLRCLSNMISLCAESDIYIP